MQDQDFKAKLDAMMDGIDGLPAPERAKIERLAEETRERHTRMKGAVTQLQESLDYLRLSIKYLVFDLEATRRENKQLRKLLKSGPDLHEPAD